MGIPNRKLDGQQAGILYISMYIIILSDLNLMNNNHIDSIILF
jgi:hypothetical protein